jgi:Ferritin-like domain
MFELLSILLILTGIASAEPINTTSALNPYVTAGPDTEITVSANGYTYVANGNLTSNETAPYVPYGGLGTNGTIPVYAPLSDYDYESLALVLYQEYIELDLFNRSLAMFSTADFEAAGLNAEDTFLIRYMADQKVGHALMVAHILGPSAPKQCEYQYPFHTVPEFVDFCQKLTRWGESSVYGFLPHLDSRAAAQLLLQSIGTEARQQMIFRQFEGLFPMPVFFEAGIPQSWAWTLLAPYITGCSNDTPRLVWQNFPALTVLNNPNATAPLKNATYPPAITTNRTGLSTPNQTVNLSWEDPGKPVGPNLTYKTNSTAGEPKFAVWVSQLNCTYTPLTNVTRGNGTWTASTKQPNDVVFPEIKTNGVVNGTMFVAITDDDIFLTAHNLSFINSHVVAGPAIYQAG